MINAYENLERFVRETYEYAEENSKTFSDVMEKRNLAFGAVQFAVEIGVVEYNKVNALWEGCYYKKFNCLAENKTM